MMKTYNFFLDYKSKKKFSKTPGEAYMFTSCEQSDFSLPWNAGSREIEADRIRSRPQKAWDHVKSR